MATSSKTIRDCTRTPKCSILLSNVLGISLTPSSLDVTDQNGTTNDPNKPQQYAGKALFDSFIEENKSTLHTRLNESLSEIRFAGWIQPFTLLAKGPLEDLEVIKEAWRRRFLRSPKEFNIRELGMIKSVDTEIVQQAPFLPLTKAVYEAIAALNKNNLPSSQQHVFEYLAHTYQYVHVPKPNVIRDSLGILFKEGKVYSSGNDYFVLVDSQSDISEDNKKEKKTTSVKEKTPHEKHVPCVVCESTNHKLNSTHAQKVQTSKGKEHAPLCEKHKRGEKKTNNKGSSSKESNSLISKEYKDLKSDKKEKRTNTSSRSENHSKKMNDKTPKKSVWGQIACFIRGKHGGAASETGPHQKPDSMNDKNVESAVPGSDAIPIDQPGSSVDKILESKVEPDEKRKALDSANESQGENPAQIQRSNSFAARNKKRPNLVRSNTFTAGSSNKAPRPVDYDIITSRIDEQSTGISTPNQHLTRPLSREYAKKSSLSEKAIYFNTSDFVRQSTPVKDAEKITSKNNVLPQKPDSFRERNSTNKIREAERFPPTNQAKLDYPRDRNNACAVGIVRPWSSHAQTTRLDSRPVSRTNSMKETRQFSLSASCTPTGDANKPALRENRDIKRSLSLRENRKSDCTPQALQRYAGSENRDFYIGESPLKQLLTKNTGNTLPVSPSHPNYIPAIQDRSRNSTPNRNSFPSANSSLKRNSWHEASLNECDENYSHASSQRTGFSYQDEKPTKRHDVFSFDYMNRNHFSKGMIPCDCSDAGYSENYERRSASSDPYYNTPSSVHKDERSSIYSNSDYGILLDEVSSSGSSEIQSIMNQEKKLDNKTMTPYTVAKGEVVLDSSLTFIGII
ncbi:uncharacterized protein LOC116286855 [Actinia tenebrosa]|uniref:Uncharacterized protein LOC116286855 n=1 Tax=Actinia tenebrosa TaxID=6105 RepID=A0A6P8H1M6_ACTTE|nr:uncharacterized protein LOC116286855 [Actinia tenebrosa]